MPASQLADPFASSNDGRGSEAFAELAGLDDELINSERIDQGFFRNLVTKLGRGELSHAKWNIIKDGNQVTELKCCAFTDDE